MRDLKPAIHRKVRNNRRKQQRQPLPWKSIFHRLLTALVLLVSGGLIMGGGLLGAKVLVASEVFHIDQVAVEGSRRLAAEELAALSDIHAGDSIFDLDLVKIGARLEENPWVRQASVERIFPRQVVIRVVEREPAAIINLGYLYYVDAQGEVFKVLSAEDSLDFPMVTGFDRQEFLQPDDPARERLRDTMALLRELAPRAKFGLADVAEVRVDEHKGLFLYTTIGAVPVRLGWGGYAAKLDRLERVYHELAPRLLALRGIDLNVPDRVIVKLPETDARKG